MATGRMADKFRFCGIGHSMFAASLCLLPGIAPADVGLAGIVGSKALLVVDGRPAQALAVGQTLGDVQLLLVQEGRAVVDIGGKRRTLVVGQQAVGTAGDGGGSVILTADAAGHFVATGSVNGVTVRFLVDTGASMISLGAADARRIGVNIARGQPGVSMTANGLVAVVRLKLDSVRVGDITLYNVDALVHQGDLPVALLGMSFLNRMEMQRSGSTMTLKKRF